MIEHSKPRKSTCGGCRKRTGQRRAGDVVRGYVTQDLNARLRADCPEDSKGTTEEQAEQLNELTQALVGSLEQCEAHEDAEITEAERNHFMAGAFPGALEIIS